MNRETFAKANGAKMAVLFAAAVALSACSHTEDPAAVCAAPETQNQTKFLLAQMAGEVAKMGGASTEDINFADPKLLAGVQFSAVALAAADPTTHKITCTAQVSVSLPNNVPGSARDKLKEVASSGAGGAAGQLLAGGKAPITYTRQPQADGKVFLYGLDNKDSAMEIAGSLMLVGLIAKGDAAASGANSPSPDGVLQTVGASSDSSPSDAASDTPAGAEQ